MLTYFTAMKRLALALIFARTVSSLKPGCNDACLAHDLNESHCDTERSACYVIAWIGLLVHSDEGKEASAQTLGAAINFHENITLFRAFQPQAVLQVLRGWNCQKETGWLGEGEAHAQKTWKSREMMASS